MSRAMMTYSSSSASSFTHRSAAPLSDIWVCISFISLRSLTTCTNKGTKLARAGRASAKHSPALRWRASVNMPGHTAGASLLISCSLVDQFSSRKVWHLYLCKMAPKSLNAFTICFRAFSLSPSLAPALSSVLAKKSRYLSRALYRFFGSGSSCESLPFAICQSPNSWISCWYPIPHGKIVLLFSSRSS